MRKQDDLNKVLKEYSRVQTLADILQPLRSLDPGILAQKASQLKQSEGEGCAIGEVVERFLSIPIHEGGGGDKECSG